MFRSSEDLNYGFNCFAVAAIATKSRVLCESFLTTHYHVGIQSEFPKEVMHLTRNAYARYFNSKYGRTGRLGEKHYFDTPIVGLRHTITAINYILRQSLHHGMTSTPYEYPHCSVNLFFQKELGKAYDPSLLKDNERYRYLPSNNKISDNIRMNKDGLLLRSDVIDVAYVESLYVTPRNFLFQMNAKSSEEWKKEQMDEDPSSPIISLESMEGWADEREIKQMYMNEIGRPDLNMMTDLELCSIIDNQYVPRFSKVSGATIYTLSDQKKADIGNDLYVKYKRGSSVEKNGKYTTVQQIKRCIAMATE